MDVFTDEYHGTEGPLGVSDASDSEQTSTPCLFDGVFNTVLNATTIITAPNRKSAFMYQRTVKNSERCSAANLFLHPIWMFHSDLTVITHALTEKVVRKNEEGGEVFTARRSERKR